MNAKATSSPKSDSGFSYKLVVRLCGLLGLGSLFLPFFNQKSGYSLVMDIKEGKSEFGDLFTAFSGEADHTMSTVIGIFLFSGLMIVTLVSLYMLITARYAGGPLTIVLLFNIAAWVLLQFGGTHAGIAESLFGYANYGYWIATGALFAPFVAMFFLDKSV